MKKQTAERPPGALVAGKAFVHDGYDFRGYVAEMRALHPALRFDWRPIHKAELLETMRKASNLSEQAAEHVSCALLAKHLLWWDAVDLKGEPMPLSADSLMTNFSDFFRQRLMRIVSCQESSDWDPEWQEGDAPESGFNLEADQKN